MKTADLYAGFDWGDFELLISQQDISDAKLTDAPAGGGDISLDEAVCRAFKRSRPSPAQAGEDGMESLLFIAGRSYRTALMPRVISLDEGETGRAGCRLLKTSFARHGLTSVFFSGDKIRYIVDMDKFTAEAAL